MDLPIEAELLSKLLRGALAEDLGTSEPATEAPPDLEVDPPLETGCG